MKTAGLAVEKGYKNIHVYNEGIPEWKKKGHPLETAVIYPQVAPVVLTAPQLKAMIDRKEDVFLLDIRDEDDRKIGWIKGAVNIDLEALDDKFRELPKSRKIALYDLRGKQAPIAARYLAHVGFTNVAILKEGYYEGWHQKGMPAEK